jgi:hypothetical protein
MSETYAGPTSASYRDEVTELMSPGTQAPVPERGR